MIQPLSAVQQALITPLQLAEGRGDAQFLRCKQDQGTAETLEGNSRSQVLDEVTRLPAPSGLGRRFKRREVEAPVVWFPTDRQRCWTPSCALQAIQPLWTSICSLEQAGNAVQAQSSHELMIRGVESRLKTFRPIQNLLSWSQPQGILPHLPLISADVLVSRMERQESETLTNEMEEMSGRVDVTLDPDTANPFLILASDQRGVGRGNEWTLLPNNPERFDTEPCVLGSQGFTEGRHYWEVEVAKGGDWWAVGVAQESVRRKGVLSFAPQEGIWAVGQWFGQYHAFTDPDWTPLHLACLPRAIQVCLDFTDRQVAFADAENEASIFAFCLASCPGERLRPWLWVGMDSWLTLCP